MAVDEPMYEDFVLHSYDKVRPADISATGWGIMLVYRSTNQSLTKGQFNKIQFDTVTRDYDSMFSAANYTFTPKGTGTYLISSVNTIGGALGRFIASVLTGTSTEVARIADGNLTQVGATALVQLTAGTAYYIAVYPVDDTGTAAQGGSSQTYLSIIRSY